MRYLGIDPGTHRTGWAIIETNQGFHRLLAYGCFETQPNSALPHRLQLIYEHIRSVCQQYRPDHSTVEELFFATNAKTAMAVSAARGVVLLALEQSGLPIRSLTPLQVKQAITGFGKADKTQVQAMVKAILHLKDVPKPDDAADAVALALISANGGLGSVKMLS